MTVKKVETREPVLAEDLPATKVHIADWGHSIEWFDTELGADNVYAWAKEQAGQVSHEMFDGWVI